MDVYTRLVGEPADRGALDASVADRVERNGLLQLAALSLTKLGDRVVDPKTVLPYLLAAGGAPTVLVALLVPVRESGALLPQVALLSPVQRARSRARAWAVGALGQAVAVAIAAFAAATLRGVALGLAVLGALVVFSLSRAVSSLAYKDVAGRTLPKGERGRVTGLATSASGLAAIVAGAAAGLLGQGTSTRAFAVLLAGAVLLWLVAAALFVRVQDPPPDSDAADDRSAAVVTRDAITLLRRPAFRTFVIARTLLLVSALTPPFVVALATRGRSADLAGAGLFVVTAGVASFVGGRAWGGAADRSSRLVMATAAGLASLVALAVVAVSLTPAADSIVPYLIGYLALAVVHVGARVGRSTYIVDLAEGDTRTSEAAVANTLMGVLLLVVGGVSGAVAALGPQAALLLLAGLGLLGVPAALRLPEVEGR